MTNPVKRMQSAVLATTGAFSSAFGLGRKVQSDMMGANAEYLPPPPPLSAEREQEHREKKAKGWNKTNTCLPKNDGNENRQHRAIERRKMRAAKKAWYNERTQAGLDRAADCAMLYESIRRIGISKQFAGKFSKFRAVFNRDHSLSQYLPV